MTPPITTLTPTYDGVLTPGTEDDGYGFPYAGYITYNGVDYPVTDVDLSGDRYVNVPEGATPLPVGALTPPLALVTEPLPLCFTAGTLITDHRGFASDVVHISPNDIILTTAGCARVLWVGKQLVQTRFGVAERLMPVRLAQGSLGDNLPNSDLTVSNDHAFHVEGILATAGSLVNGTSIYRVPLDEFEDGTITYYHIETENHEIIYANGAPAETFIDNVSRQVFDNYQEYVDLYGEEREMDELPIPRAMSPRQLPKKIKARLAARAIELGYAEKAVA